MENINILTTQNVAIQRKVAGLGYRLIALIVDLAILLAFGLAFNLAFGFDSPRIAIVATIIIYLYPLLCDLFFQGRTFGRMAVNIKVVKLDGTSPGIFDYLVRWIMIIPDYLLTMGGLAFLWMIIGDKGQRLGDYAAGTTIIRYKTKISLESTGFIKLEDDYKPAFEEIKLLESSDIKIVKEVLDHVKTLNPGDTSAIVLLYKVKKKICDKVNINSEMKPKKFLEAVIADYNYYSSRL